MGTLVPFPYTCTTCKKKKKRKKIISHATTKQALCSSNHPSPQLTLILSKLHNHFLNKNLLRKLILLIPVPPYYKGRHSSFPTPRGIDSPSNFSKKKKSHKSIQIKHKRGRMDKAICHKARKHGL